MDPTPAPLQPVPAPQSGSPLAGLLAALVALVTALGGYLASWRGYEGGQDTQRAAYAALKAHSEQQAAQMQELARGQLELRAWVSELSDRIEKRQTNTEKVLRRVKPTAPAPAPAPPAPPAPRALEVRPPPALPPFEALQQ